MVIAEISTGLLAGAFFLGVFGLRRSLDVLSDPVHIQLRQAAIPSFRRVLFPMMFVAVAATGLTAWEFGPEMPLASGAFLLCCSLPLITFAVNVPINKRVMQWNPEAPPANWRRQIARWNFGDSLRLVLSFLAFISLETGLLVKI